MVDLESDDNKRTVIVDQILVGIGRTPNVQGINLEAAGVEYDDVPEFESTISCGPPTPESTLPVTFV